MVVAEYDKAGGYAPNNLFKTENVFDQESVEECLASWRAQQQVSSHPLYCVYCISLIDDLPI